MGNEDIIYTSIFNTTSKLIIKTTPFVCFNPGSMLRDFYLHPNGNNIFFQTYSGATAFSTIWSGIIVNTTSSTNCAQSRYGTTSIAVVKNITKITDGDTRMSDTPFWINPNSGHFYLHRNIGINNGTSIYATDAKNITLQNKLGTIPYSNLRIYSFCL